LFKAKFSNNKFIYSAQKRSRMPAEKSSPPLRRPLSQLGEGVGGRGNIIKILK
jgi:hypothetical protein